MKKNRTELSSVLIWEGENFAKNKKSSDRQNVRNALDK